MDDVGGGASWCPGGRPIGCDEQYRTSYNGSRAVESRTQETRQEVGGEVMVVVDGKCLDLTSGTLLESQARLKASG